METPKASNQPRIRLTEARNKKGWSQDELANRIGTTHINISRWERGITRPGPYFRRKLASLFNATEQELDLEQSPAPSLGVPANSVAIPIAETPSSEAAYDPAIPLQPATALVGRDAELARLKERLYAGGNVALTALNGLPGVGKTALSITLAHDAEVRAHFRNGILWAGLGPTPNLAGLLSRWGTLLGISATELAALKGSEAWARALRAAIGDRSMLLVIDDAWKIEDALYFKVGGPHCTHLLTTRFPAIASQIAVEGATLVQELNETESMALLRMLAPNVVAQEPERALALVHAVGGLPLALTLMGNYLRKQAYSGQARRIQGALEYLTSAEARLRLTEPRGPVEAHPSLPEESTLSLQSVIAVTDEQLSPEARAALYALSAFPPKPDSFSEEAALAVANCTIEALDALSDAGLLESSGSERYTLHQTIADYARLHLQEQTPHDRLIAYFSNFVEQHKKDYELLEQESNLILAALETAYKLNRQAELLRLVSAFAPYLLLRAFYQQAEQQVQRTHQAALALNDQRGLITTLLYMGELSQKQVRFSEAENHYQQGLTLARQLNDQPMICALLSGLGNVSGRRGEYTQAETYLQEGLSIVRQLDDEERVINLLRSLGSVALNQGDFTQSKVYLEEGLELARRVGDRDQICPLLINLGVVAGQQGDYIQAEIYLHEGLVLARQIRHREWTSALLGNLGDAARELGNYKQAEVYFMEGLTLARQIGQRERMSILLLNLGEVALAQENYAQAGIFLQEALPLARQVGRPQIVAHILYEFGNLYLNQEEVEEAKSCFQEVLNTAPERNIDLIALANYGLSRVAAVKGNLQEAGKLAKSSVETLEKIGHRNAGEVRQWVETLSD